MNKEKIINEIDNLISVANSLKQSNDESSSFTRWSNNVIGLINNVLSNQQEKKKSFENIQYNPNFSFNDSGYKEAFLSGLNQAIGLLMSWKEEIHKYSKSENKKKQDFTHTCFIVHGHNNEIKLEVKDFVQDYLEIECIILHKKTNQGKTIVEKFEKHSYVDFAICLWTKDDEGKAICEQKYYKRARQNVILETGYFWGKYGRERTIIIHEEGVEIPSDFKGLIYIPFCNNWKDELRKEIEHKYKFNQNT